MARKKRRAEWQAGELNLTAMIDVAFQLLNFFVITSHPVDVFTNLDIFRPQAEKIITQETETKDLLEITVHRDGYAFQKANVAIGEIERQLTRLASYDKSVPIIIKCTGDSTHAGLVSVLDLCAKVGLKKISVFSM